MESSSLVDPRETAKWIGLASVGFGVFALVAPRSFARLFGIPLTDDPIGPATMRNIGARDLVLGMGLWSAAKHGGKYRPWILARGLADLGDAFAGSVAIAQGARHPRFQALTLMAITVAALEFFLHRSSRDPELRT